MRLLGVVSLATEVVENKPQSVKKIPLIYYKFSNLSILKILLIPSVLFSELSLPFRASISIEKILPARQFNP
jgi:hypothetical protein